MRVKSARPLLFCSILAACGGPDGVGGVTQDTQTPPEIRLFVADGTTGLPATVTPSIVFTKSSASDAQSATLQERVRLVTWPGRRGVPFDVQVEPATSLRPSSVKLVPRAALAEGWYALTLSSID